jgi:hypothetical protein
MTIYIQNEAPEEAKLANWIPCPDDGTWFVVLRMYRLHDTVLNATWKCPAIQ